MKKKRYCIDCKFYEQCKNEGDEVCADDQICEDFEIDTNLANTDIITTSKLY